ncbi:GAP family protein [Cellulomonas cellasea]|uniref:GAP family protein n=1 Tax=Cellulomonas cellasea TaxID=43670 RepID=UPI0025A334DF|nr:GAP family protein [Cellulomonas cellasea]MDM8084207.1 GAP family protein [Cellulomonas cellasea]
MDALTPTLLAILAGLALVDSLSLGTLGLPVWMLAQPRFRTRVVLVYLATIAAFYWLLGAALLAGVGVVAEQLATPDGPVLDWVQLAIGVLLFLASFLFDGPIGRWRRERREMSGRQSRWQRWRASLVGPDADAGAAALAAVGAGAVEVATMAPYLGAIGLLAVNGVGLVPGAVVLAGYGVVMVAPALTLLALRLVLAAPVERPLARLNKWFERRGGDVLAWTLGVVGFLVATDALGRLRDSVG